jgi:SAM-dependent methyltransferase
MKIGYNRVAITKMNETEFDKFADEYDLLHAKNVNITCEAPDYFVEYKILDICNQISKTRNSYENLRILDFGSGVGSSIPFYRLYFPSCYIVCADVSRRSLELAKGRFGELASYVLFEGESLPLRSGVFDIALAACVFHHIPWADHVGLLREIRRVLAKEAGRLFIYEHNPLNPLTLRAVRTCEFDRDAVLIPSWRMRAQLQNAGYAKVSIRYRVFFPRFLAFLRFLELRMPYLPLGAQYCVEALASTTDEDCL